MLLNLIFVVHAGLAAVLAALLLFAPDWFAQMVMGVTWASGEMADAAKVYARFAAVGLILVVIVTTRARQSSYYSLRYATTVCMAIFSLLGLLVALFWIPFYLLKILAILGNAIFLLAYLAILYFFSDQI